MATDNFITRYTQPVIELLNDAQVFLLNTWPELAEEVDEPSRILVYRIAAGNNGIVFTLIPSRTGVKLGFYRGRALPDPAGLMQGSGKVHSSIPLTTELLASPILRSLVQTAIDHARDRNTRR